MDTKVLRHLSVALLPFGSYAMPATSYSTSHRSYLAVTEQRPYANYLTGSVQHQPKMPVLTAALATNAEVGPELIKAQPVRELVIIDAAVPDKELFYRSIKPGVDIVEIGSSQSGLAQLKAILKNYQGLKGLHIVSHAEEGVMLLGNSRVDSAVLTSEKDIFASLNAALIHGADLVLYGCDLASSDNGGTFLDIIRSNTHVDVAASNNKTGNSERGGDWDLEVQRGNIETELAFSEKALKDFSATLAPVVFQSSSWTVTTAGTHNGRFTPNGTNNAAAASIDAQVTQGGRTLTVNGAYNSTGVEAVFGGDGIYFGFSESSITLSFTDGSEFKPSSVEIYSTSGDPATITTNNGGSLNVTITDKYSNNYTTQTIDLSSLPAGATSLTITNNSWAPFAVNQNSGFFGHIKKITFDSIGPTNVAPTATNLTQNLNFTEDSGAVVITDIVVTDADSGDTITATLTLSNSSAGSLTTGTFGSVTSSFNAGVWTASGTVSDVNAALAAVSYSPAVNWDQNFSIATQIRDAADTGPANGTISFTATAVNDAPVVTASGSTTAFTEGNNVASTPVVIDSVLTLSDIDSVNMSSATISITGGFQTDQDVLAFTNQNGITGSYNAGTGVLTLSGSATGANYQTALRSVTYSNSSENPNTSNRTISFVVNDGTDNSLAATKTVSVTAVNDAPTDLDLNPKTLNQSATNGTVVGTLSSTDLDSVSFTYSLVSGAGDSDNGSFTISGNQLIATTPSAIAAGPRSVLIQTSDGTNSISEAFTITVTDNLPPVITAVSIPNSAHKVGDSVIATITVSSDLDDYTTGSGSISGTINGYSLGSLTRQSATSYTATFSVTNGGTDRAAGSNIPVSLTLKDSTGNTSATFNTAISQSSDAIFANLPEVSLSASSNSINENAGSSTLTASLSGSLNNQWPTAITVNLAYTGTATAGTDYSKSDSISITANSSSGTATVTAIDDNMYDAAANETVIADIDTVSVGTLGSTSQQSITIVDNETAPVVSLSVGSSAIAEHAGTSSITATLNHATYEDVVVSLGYAGTATTAVDYNTPSSSITIAAGALTANAAVGIEASDDGDEEGAENILIDITNVTGGSALANGTQQQSVSITDDDDETPPVISTVTIPNVPMKVGDSVTATIGVDDDTDTLTLVSGSIAGINLASVSKTNDTTYTASFTIPEAGTDFAAGADLPVSLVLKDSADNNSLAFTDAISQNADEIDANRPVISTATRLTPATLWTNSDSLTWRVTFSEAVTGVDAADFTLSASGASVTGLVANSATEYDVTFSGGTLASHNGVVALLMAASYSIVDGLGNAMNSPMAGITIAGADVYQVDNVAALAPTNLGLEAASDCGISNVDRITNDNTPTIFGNGSGVDLITLYGTDGVTPLGSATVDCNVWTIQSSTLVDGTHSLTAKAKDEAGNESVASTPLVIVIDTVVATSAAPDLADGSDTGISNSDNLTTNTTPTFGGTVEPNSKVTVSSSVAGVLGNVTANGSGVWSYTVGTALAAGVHNISIVEEDVAGNISAASALLELTIDSTAPQISTNAPASGSTPGAASVVFEVNFNDTVHNISANDFTLTTVDTTGSVSAVSATSGSSVDVTVGGLTGNGTIRLDHVTSDITDAAGNILAAYSAGTPHTVDRVAPNLTTVDFTQTAVDMGNQNNLSVTVAFAGTETAALGANYSIISSGGGTAVTGSGTVNTTGDSISGLNVSSLLDGTLTISLTLTDEHGNVSSAVTDTIVKDANAPAVSAVVIADGRYKAGETVSVTLTFTEALVLSSANSNYSLTIDVGGASRQAVLTGHAGAVLTFSYTVQAGEDTTGTGVSVATNGLSLLNGATIKDAGNNAATLNFTGVDNSAAQVDTTAPVISVVTDPAQAVFVNAANYQIKGTHSEIGLTINLYTDTGNDGTADGAVLAGAVVDADGNWSLLQPLTADTAHNYVVVAEDAAGNISAAVDVPTITEDSIAPGAAVITSPATALAVNTVNQVISGTHAEDGVTVELFADADNDGVADNSTVLANAVVGSAATGTWSLTAPLTQNVANNFVVVVKDKAGNVSTVTDVPTITQDSVAPVVTVTTLVTADSTPALAGTVNDNTATLSLVVNGQTYVPTNSGNGNWALADNQISALTDGVYDVAVSATDAQGNIGTDASVNELTIDLLPPSGYSVAIQQSRIDAANQNAMSFVFAGAEVGSTYTYVISDGTNSVTGTAVVMAANQQIGSINVTGLAEGTLQLSVSLTDTVGNTGAAATATVVKLYNATPVISGTAATSVNEDSPYSFTPAATDADTGTTFTFSISNKPVWATFNTATGALSGTPGNEHVGTTSGIVISVSDGTATASLPAFAITVVNTNDAPVVSSAAVTVATQGAAYSYSFAGTDVDVGDTLTRSVVTKPAWLNFNAGTGVLSGTPGSGDVGTHTVTLRVTDAAGLFADQSFNVIVANINDAPTIAGSPAVTVAQGAAYSFIPTAADVDTGTTLTFSIANKPSWATFNTATGALSGTPANADVGGTAGIVISVSDGELSAALPAFTLTVTNTNDAPTITGNPAVTVAQGAAYSFTPTAADVDTGTTLTFSIANKPSWATFNTATGALSGTPANVDVGATVGIVISVSDGELSAALPAFTLTVTNTNDAPTITGSPAVTVAQGAVYSFIPTAADVDTGTTLTFSIANKPSWATFNTATGALSGTPANVDVGATAGIVISVSDGELSAALPAFTLTVTNTNDAPTTTDRSATLEEDTSLSVTLTAQDPDQDRLTFEIVTQPEHGTATLLGAVLIYTPEPDFNGTDSIGFIAKDAELSSNVASLSLTVTAANDHPVVEDDSYNLQRTTNNQYLLNVLANDSDVDDDTLVIDGASSSVGTVSFNAQGLTLTAPDRYVGPVSLRYTVTDGNGGRASADVSLIIEGGAAADLPVITVPADIEVNATALFTRVPIGTATAVDRNGRRLRVSLINGSLFFAPGEHIVYWQATDADGNTATKAQKVSVNPLISLSKDQLVTEGTDVAVEVILNGPAPVYPVLVPYTVSGRADGNDHTLVSGVAEISSGLSTSIRFTVLEDGQAEGTEDIVISLDASVNRGSQRTSRIVVTEANIAPVVALDVQQNGESRLTISESAGVVTVTATVTDANVQDQVTGVWSFGRLDNVTSDQTQLSFDPAEQGPGLYLVSYTATDSGTPNLSTTARAFIVIRPNLPTLGTQDTDGDLVPDDQEGFADSDGDGIPDYMDAINECNVMPTELLGQTEFVAEGDPGVCLRLGTVAAETDAGGLQIAKDAIDTDNVAVNIGGIFDFIAYGLPEQGQSYSLVIPQRLPVPANAVYRKFSDAGWVDFVSNERNSIASTQGERGFCPPPGGTEWTEGLTEGHWCVQVTVEDGGPNDADGIANSAIVDPGGVAVELNGNNLPVAVADQASTRVDTPVDVNVLANDTDPDGDSLTVSQAIGSFGTVTILANQQLSYTPNPDFIGTDTVIYNITDGKGGTASSELVISVSGNSSPVAVNDVASTDDKTVVLIAVLANDSDEDGNTLMVSSASAVQGTVSIEADQRLRYTPKVGFDGVDTISYRITDGVGGEATAQVSVTVRAYQPVVVDNKSSGGSMTMWMVIVLAGAVVLRRRSMLAVAAAVLLSFSPFSQGADWYLQASAGQSNADQKQSRLVEQLPDGTITGFDDSDSSYGFTLGYQVHPYVALEAGYLDLGEASSQISAESLTPQQYHEVVKAVSPVLVDGFTAAVRFSLWQNEQWNLEVPLGVLFWDSEIESRMDDTVLKSETDGTDIYLGVQLNYQLAAGWKVGVGYQQLNLKPNDVNSWLVSLRYEF
jgi:hypothetical protein